MNGAYPNQDHASTALKNNKIDEKDFLMYIVIVGGAATDLRRVGGGAFTKGVFSSKTKPQRPLYEGFVVLRCFYKL